MKYLSIIILAVTLLFSSCEKWLTVQPKAVVVADKMFETEDGFKSALTGCYLLMRNIYRPDSHMVGYKLVEGMAATWETSEGSSEKALITRDFEHQGITGILDHVFQSLYKIIANLDIVIDALEKQTILSESSYNKLYGEALALRAYIHFDLIRLWGPAPGYAKAGKVYLPYVTKQSTDNYEYLTYESYMKILRTDLNKAEELLGKSDPILSSSNADLNSANGGYWGYRQSRVNYYAVLGLQARVNLWMGDKPNALRYAKMVKEAVNTVDATPKFRLGTANDFVTWTDGTLFMEHLFGVQVEDFDPYKASFAHYTNTPVFNGDIPALYDKNLEDIRYKFQWITCKLPFGFRMTSRKYHGFSMSTTPQNTPLMRLAEMYLIIMECGSLDECNSAFQELCTARNAEFIPFEAGDRTRRIANEYQKELIAEGQVFYAYKRLALTTIRWSSMTYAPDHYVLPLPQKEIEY